MGAETNGLNNPALKYPELTGLIIKAAMTVHNDLGTGYPETIYQRALAIEFAELGISFEREFAMPIYYKGHHVGTRRADFLVNKLVSVELKAMSTLEPVHMAQAINYLEAYNLEVGLLINFGAKSLQFKRFTNKKVRTGIQDGESH